MLCREVALLHNPQGQRLPFSAPCQAGESAHSCGACRQGQVLMCGKQLKQREAGTVHSSTAGLHRDNNLQLCSNVGRSR